MNQIAYILFLLTILYFTQILVKVLRLKKEKHLKDERKLNLYRLAILTGTCLFFFLYLTALTSQVFRSPTPNSLQIISDPLFSSVQMLFMGTFLILSANILLYLSIKAFKTEMRFNLDRSHTGKLVTNGILAYSRNPFFLSLLLLFAGIAIAYSNLLFIGTTVLSMLTIHIQVLKEEKFLTSIHGQDYLNYKKKTRRYF